MPDFRKQLQESLGGKLCLVGLGNPDFGDDGLGLRLAEMISERLDRVGDIPGAPEVIMAGTSPEAYVGRIPDGAFDHLVFLDAVEFGGGPGSVILLDSEQMASRFPQISTHKISLGLLAKWIESSGTTRAWLLGIQPGSLKAARELTPPVHDTLEILNDLLCSLWCGGQSKAPGNCQPDDQSQRWNYVIP